jgi:hypothetical protein
MRAAHKIVNRLLENEDDVGAEMQRIIGGKPTVLKTDQGTLTKYPNGRELAEYPDGRAFFLRGRVHREDGPAVELDDGTKEWFLSDQRHREDGPAVVRADGTKEWWLDDARHRDDGPAVEWADGAREWWLDGEKMTQEEHARRIRNR